ncbi:rCG49095, partial [Rattus norvegicus]
MCEHGLTNQSGGRIPQLRCPLPQ